MRHVKVPRRRLSPGLFGGRGDGEKPRGVPSCGSNEFVERRQLIAGGKCELIGHTRHVFYHDAEESVWLTHELQSPATDCCDTKVL
jgi:hypothetical protein